MYPSENTKSLTSYCPQEQEAKIEFMRKQTQKKYGALNKTEVPINEKPVDPPSSAVTGKLEHVNFFKDLEDGAVVTNATNKDHEREVKEEKEKYEKQIGYLTYLGQDTNEATGKVSWYEKPRVSLLDDDTGEENDAKKKIPHDPIHKYKHFFDKHRFVPKSSNEKLKIKDDSDTTLKKKHKHKKKKLKSRKTRPTSSNSSSSEDEQERKIKRQTLLILRDKRLKREREEKARAEKVLARMRGEITDEPMKEPEPPVYVQKYNSQFNPHLAKQNATR